MSALREPSKDQTLGPKKSPRLTYEHALAYLLAHKVAFCTEGSVHAGGDHEGSDYGKGLWICNCSVSHEVFLQLSSLADLDLVTIAIAPEGMEAHSVLTHVDNPRSKQWVGFVEGDPASDAQIVEVPERFYGLRKPRERESS